MSTPNPQSPQSAQPEDAAGQSASQRLKAFEEMLASLQADYEGTCRQLEELRAAGKVKTVTYKQLTANKLAYQTMLGMYRQHGLIL